ncbi:hypothetical protein PVAP13_1NG028072 [Panicum virgatum]|uniref:Uncharacterized protein n=1 Tax=Panicum virgatum TaxID=38727 RepID=A0A8T0WKC0_PANVG|nr:hypothetical protein PVAP13_1NG028072 [Panicum virgatum]
MKIAPRSRPPPQIRPPPPRLRPSPKLHVPEGRAALPGLFRHRGGPKPRHPSAAAVLASGAPPARIRSSLERIGAGRRRIELRAPAARALPCAVDNSCEQ